MKITEEELAEKVKDWLEEKYYPKRKKYEVIADINAKNKADVRVLKNGQLILQIETKTDDFYSAIGQAICYCYEYDVPTFIAIPYTLKGTDWDCTYARDVFKDFEVKIGVLVLQENGEIEGIHDPLRKFVG